MIVGFLAVWAKVIMLHRSNKVKQIFDFIMCVFYFVVFACKGSVFSLVGQEMRWFLLVLLTARRLLRGISGMVFVLYLTVWHTKKA